MKKTITLSIIIAVCSVFSLSAQVVEKPNRIGLHIGAGIPLSKGTGSVKHKASANIAIDYGRAVTDKMEIGAEANFSLGGVDKSLQNDEYGLGESKAYLLKGRYAITGDTYKGFYASLGLGMGKAAYLVGNNNAAVALATNYNFAFMPEVGYRHKFFSVGLKYLHIGGKVTDNLGEGVKLKYNVPAYQDLQLSVGLNLGW